MKFRSKQFILNIKKKIILFCISNNRNILMRVFVWFLKHKRREVNCTFLIDVLYNYSNTRLWNLLWTRENYCLRVKIGCRKLFSKCCTFNSRDFSLWFFHIRVGITFIYIRIFLFINNQKLLLIDKMCDKYVLIFGC